MASRDSVEIRMISSKQLADDLLSSMLNHMKRDGWRLIKQPAYRSSRKNPEDVLVYTEWVKDFQ